jgi:DNA-binding CsgD family transcriptional regulator
VVAFGQRDLDGALAIVTSILDEAGSRPMRITAWAIHLRSLIRFTRGEVHEALADCQESLRRFRDAHYPGGITEALAAIAVIAGASDQIAAVRIWAAAERMDEARGASFQPPERDVYESAVSRLRAALGEEVFQSERATGRSWSAQEAIDAGLAVRLEAPKQDRPVLRPPAIALSVLSPRETEVLSYVAAGWTNDRIAEHLYLSPRTVHAHLTTIYRKLNVANRAAAVRLALESGISG